MRSGRPELGRGASGEGYVSLPGNWRRVRLPAGMAVSKRGHGPLASGERRQPDGLITYFETQLFLFWPVRGTVNQPVFYFE